MGEISVWVKGYQKNIGGVTHRTTAAEIVRFTLTECVWRTTEKARRSGRCYALFENWRGCQRLIPPCKRIYKLWKLWGLERIHVKFVVKKVAMETLARKDFGEYVEASQLKVPKRHIALRTQPHALDTDESDQTTSSDSVGLFIIDESDSEGGRSPTSRNKRMLLKHVLRQNDQLHTLSKTVEDVDEEILFYEAKLHHFRVVEDGNDYVQHAYWNGKEESSPKGPHLDTHDQSSDLNHSVNEAGAVAPSTDTPDPNKPHKRAENDVRVIEHIAKDDSTGNNTNGPYQSKVQSRTKKDFSPKSNTKIVVVNPLPRNEVPPSVQKQTEKEMLKERDSKGAITTTSEGLSVPRSRLPYSRTKRRMKNGNRSKRKVPGLYEFEQSCEWLKVMDKELKRLESMENLSFVDWDSESLLSEKQLTFASGNRKFRFRSAFSGKQFKKYDLSENLTNFERPTELDREFSKLQIEKTSTTSTSPLSHIEENKNLSEGAVINKNEKPLFKSDDLGDGTSKSVNGVSLKGGSDDLNAGTSSTKAANTINAAIVNRSEEVKPEIKSTDRLQLSDEKTDDVKTPSHSSYSGEYPPNTVDDLDQKNLSPEVRSVISRNEVTTYHQPLSTRNANENVKQKENSTHGNRLSVSTSPKEDIYSRHYGSFYHRDLRPENDSKNHAIISDRENIAQLNLNKFASNTGGKSSPEMSFKNGRRAPLQPNISAVKPRPVTRNCVAIHSNAGKDPKNISERKNASEDATKSRVLGPVLEPKSSPVSVRRVPKPPIYFPTEACGPVLYVPNEEQSTPRHSPRENFLKQTSKNFSSGPHVVPEAKASVITAVHPRVEQLRTSRLHPGSVSKTSDVRRDPGFPTKGISPVCNGDKAEASLTVGLVLGTTKTNTDTLEPNIYGPKHSTPPLHSVSTDLPVPRSRMKSPDQGLGSEVFSPEEKSKPQENDSSSDTGMSSLHSQDSGISNASVVMETWV